MEIISIVMGTYNRWPLLERSLEMYARQSWRGGLEIIVVDDWSDDGTDEGLVRWSELLPIVKIRPTWKEPGSWRDSASIINVGIRAAKGDFIVATHPEVMPGLRSLEAMREQAGYAKYVCCRPYYLSPGEQGALDSVDWKGKGPIAVRELPGFYGKLDSPEFTGNRDYTPEGVERAPQWNSWVFGGMTRETWHRFGGFTEFEVWGAVDLDFMARRAAFGIKNVTLNGDSTFCVHQNHDGGAGGIPETPRDLARAHREAAVYANAADSVRRNLWNQDFD